MRHRLDGPTYILADGSEAWYKNGLCHRSDGPAVTNPNSGLEVWYKDGKKHRLDGPAFFRRNPYLVMWHVDGEEIPNDEVHEWMQEMSIRPDWENWGDVEKTMFRLRF